LAKQETDKSKYKTRYAVDTYVTAAQYIAELILESCAVNEKTILPFKFWNTKKWHQLFIYQCMLANKLLKQYTATQLIDAIRKTKGITSLRNPYLKKNIKVSTPITNKETNIVQSGPATQRPPVKSDVNLLDKLKDL